MFYGNVLNTNMRISYFLCNKQILYLNILRVGGAPSVREKETTTELSQNIFKNLAMEFKISSPKKKILEPYRLIISYMLCFHS